MTEWREATLGEVVTLQRGFDITKKEQRAGRVPVVSSSGIGSYHDEAKVDAPGVVIGRKGSLGTVFYLEEPFWPHDTTLWVKDFKGNDPYFCHLLLRGLPLAELDGGAANPTLNRNHAHTLKVRIPAPALQRRIGAILAALDDLIAINERRIELLEDLVRSIYREWFVRRRYPGAEVNENTKIPDGWEIGTVGRFLDVIGGGTPSKAEPSYWEDGSVDWYTPSDLTRARRRFAHRSADRITELGVQRSSARKFPAGSVLMTSRATLGVLAIATGEATTNQGFIVITPVDGLPPTFVYEWLAEHEGELAAIATGATFKEITKGAFKRFEFVKPSSAVLSAFGETVLPVESQIRTLEEANQCLSATRDLLLPRLVTGQLDISDVDLGELLTEDAA